MRPNITSEIMIRTKFIPKFLHTNFSFLAQLFFLFLFICKNLIPCPILGQFYPKNDDFIKLEIRLPRYAFTDFLIFSHKCPRATKMTILTSITINKMQDQLWLWYRQYSTQLVNIDIDIDINKIQDQLWCRHHWYHTRIGDIDINIYKMQD